MDELERLWYGVIFRTHFLEKRGTEFQDWFVKLAGYAWGDDFEEVRPYGNVGDWKCDGWRISTGSVTRQIDKLEADLQGFQIVSAYDELVADANRLQAEVEDLTNANFLDQEIISNLERALADERPPELTDLQRVYAEAGVVLPGVSLAKYEKVEEFHRAILRNRHLHLQAELDDARARSTKRRQTIAIAQRRRNELLTTINSGGALSHYRQMDAQLIQLRSERQQLTAHLRPDARDGLFRAG